MKISICRLGQILWRRLEDRQYGGSREHHIQTHTHTHGSPTPMKQNSEFTKRKN